MGNRTKAGWWKFESSTMRGVWKLIAVEIMVLSTVTSLPLCADKACILEAAEELFRAEQQQATGANVTLTTKERIVDEEVLKPMKYREINLRERLPWKNVPERELLSFIRRMPKGGNLHIHDIAMVDIQWVIENLTYLPDLYYCTYTTDIDEFIRFRFSDTENPEKAKFCQTKWFSVSEKRGEIGAEEFDKMLLEKLTMVHIPERHEGDAWAEFIGSLIPVGDLKYTDEGFRLYFKQALAELYNDNVLYVEVRTLLDPLLRSDGTSHDEEYTLQQYISVAEEFKRENPDFIGVKIIYITVRSSPKEDIEREIRLAMALHQKYPNDLVGYDLVGYENLGPTLRDHLDILLIPSQEGVDLPFFFHVGETNRFGEHVDEDIAFAILLNTSRIAHGFSLIKHPKIVELVKERQIPVEVCPISNHVLTLVSELRNHPATILLANGLPVVINSDDPAAWHLTGLSTDYFAAFMQFSRAGSGLAFLKEMSLSGLNMDEMILQYLTSRMGMYRKLDDRELYGAATFVCAQGSHQGKSGPGGPPGYSAMNDTEKEDAFDIWQRKWDHFIDFYHSRWQEDSYTVHTEL